MGLRPEPFAPYRILWKKSRGLPRSCLKFLFCLDREKLNLFHLNTPKLFLETWSKTFQNLQLNSKLSHKKRIFLRIFLIYNVDSWDIAKIWNGRSSIIRCLTIKPFIFYQTAWSHAILNGISVLFLPWCILIVIMKEVYGEVYYEMSYLLREVSPENRVVSSYFKNRW